jgi:hypothetical protein
MSGDRFQKTAPVAQVVRDGTDRVLAVPGVKDVGVSNCLPMAGGFGMVFDVVGRPKGNAPFTWRYFNALKIPLLRGRGFTQQDDGTAPGVVIINQAMARHYWPKGDPLNDRIQIGPGAGPAFAEGPRQVVGIVADIHVSLCQWGGTSFLERAPESVQVAFFRIRRSQDVPLGWWFLPSQNRTSISGLKLRRALAED